MQEHELIFKTLVATVAENLPNLIVALSQLAVVPITKHIHFTRVQQGS